MNRNTEFLINFRKFIKYYEFCLKDINQKYDLAKIELDIISFLLNNPGRDTLSDIVELRMLQKGNVSKAVNDLIDRELIIRKPDENDKRKVHLILTEKSNSITKDISIAKNNYIDNVFRDFTEEELELFFNLNKKISNNIEIYSKEVNNGK